MQARTAARVRSPGNQQLGMRLIPSNAALAERVDHLAQRLGERRVARFEANREALDAQQRAGTGRTRRADRLHDGVEPLAILLAQRAARAQVLAQPREQLTQSPLAHSRPPARLSRWAERAAGRAAATAVAEQILPGVLAPESLALLRELHALGGERDHVGLAIDLDLALELLVELGSHCVPYFTRPSDLRASIVRGRAPTRSCSRLSCGQRPMSTLTCAPQPSTT